ncbi:Protein sel-1 1 [Vanrija pseudolonga]|uniref:Protein sel-1 1 n=1 Tax=Vanrija pseudolonga TaxID=143232 RepID=A0AAF0Y9B1_9TREE|nr:Protein sel-1 1 [Vanrija pseudolonga]
MRPQRRSIKILTSILLFAALVGVATAADKGQPPPPPTNDELRDLFPAEEDVEHQGEQAGHHADNAVYYDDYLMDEACAPLKEVHTLLEDMQPDELAHLEKKLGGVSPAPPPGTGLGYGSQGPVAATLRMLPKLVTALNPLTVVAKLPFIRSSGERGSRSSRSGKLARERGERVLALLDEAEANGCPEAIALRAEVYMFPPRGIAQDLSKAFTAYSRFLEVSSDPHVQFMVGFFYATGLGGAVLDQARATLLYTFSALQDYQPAQMALGYRYWSGIGVKEDCTTALDYYERASINAYNAFTSGPAGGLTLPLIASRLADKLGGIFGPHASWSSTGVNQHRHVIKASMDAARGQTEAEVLKFYQFHSDRNQILSTVRLGTYYYHGTIYPHTGAEEVGEIGRDFEAARRHFYVVAKRMWPAEFDKDGKAAPPLVMTDQERDKIHDPVMIAASYLGRMALRGEGMPKDYVLARLWYNRAAQLGDREAYNALGVIHRDGLGVKANADTALAYFKTAADPPGSLADAQINLAKMYIKNKLNQQAHTLLQSAIAHGSPFEAFHLLATLHLEEAREEGDKSGSCGVGLSYFKRVSETGSWDHDYIGEADRAWGRGEQDKALLGWWIAAETGSELAQNNVAFVIDGQTEAFGAPLPAEAAITLWVRSAAQGNADAMIKAGDYYYSGLVSNVTEEPEPDYQRALVYYQAASDKYSAMAYWNLGYMYENGLGVTRDWHLAKRNYDMALETNTSAYLPWFLSLIKLYLTSWWVDFKTRGAVPGLPLFEEADDTPTLWEGIKGLFVAPPLDQDVADNLDDDGEYDVSASGWGAGEQDLDDLGDIVESLVIIGLVGVIMLLFWLRGRRPTSMIGASSLQPASPPPPSEGWSASPHSSHASTAPQSPTPSRLKRLSLVARPRSGTGSTSASDELRVPPSPSPLGASGATGAAADDDDTPTATPGPGTTADEPLSPTPSRRPRPAHAARSSISYTPGSSGVREKRGSVPSLAALAEREDGGSKPDAGLTLTERHADLLRMIAMRERRVNELRQELAAQERALDALRAKWTSVANRGLVAEAAPAGLAGAHIRNVTKRRSPAAVAAALPDTTGERAEAEPRAADEPSLSALFSASAVEETIQEGRRFWGKLVRTVGAAAAGTVPEEGVSGLTAMLPSFSLQSAAAGSSAPAPANEGRLGAGSGLDKRRLSAHSASSSSRSRSPRSSGETPRPSGEGRDAERQSKAAAAVAGYAPRVPRPSLSPAVKTGSAKRLLTGEGEADAEGKADGGGAGEGEARADGDEPPAQQPKPPSPALRPPVTAMLETVGVGW